MSPAATPKFVRFPDRILAPSLFWRASFIDLDFLSLSEESVSPLDRELLLDYDFLRLRNVGSKLSFLTLFGPGAASSYC